MDHIFTVTAVRTTKDGSYHDSSRTWGWYKTRDEADASAIRNVDFFCEVGYYRYLVIEQLSWGGVAQLKDEWWYEAEWDAVRQVHNIKPIKRPAAYEGFGGALAMG